MYYESDFGVVKVYATRFLVSDTAATFPTSYEDVLILDKEMWSVATLQPLKTEKLAKTGLSTKIQMSTEYTLVSRQEKASAWLKNMAVSP
uniref:Putative major capsid protein n=1 Tax=viral metagenome TaxID=1070528 RepID=A0A6M3LJK5_9ZZZZ